MNIICQNLNSESNANFLTLSGLYHLLWEKAISILAGNLNLDCSYLITTVTTRFLRNPEIPKLPLLTKAIFWESARPVRNTLIILQLWYSIVATRYYYKNDNRACLHRSERWSLLWSICLVLTRFFPSIKYIQKYLRSELFFQH